ncbi:BnaCnng42450D [Brassica napus]|uniref:(rape) hypothetical protein n=1 Tax=Brassica napus TaxID=3708 RepID=A0A078JBW4_BRANA|nr:unnamed protein product [Brassica napus]CDY63693.1 BnaCnng42450D [Brassica napus]
MWKVVASFANRGRSLLSGGSGHGVEAFTSKANKILQQIAEAEDAEKKRQREEKIAKDKEIEAVLRARKARDKEEKRRVKEMRKEKKELRKMVMVSKLTGKAMSMVTVTTKEVDIWTVTNEVAISTEDTEEVESLETSTTVTKKKVAISTEDTEEVETSMTTVVKEVATVEKTTSE